MSNFPKDMPLGDIAERIMQKSPLIEDSNFSTNKVVERFDGPDHSHIKVPDDFINSLLGKSSGKKVITEKKTVTSLDNKTPQELIKELKEVIIKATSIIEEMTTCGMLGVNIGSPKKKKNSKKVKFSLGKITDSIKSKKKDESPWNVFVKKVKSEKNT